MNKTEVGLIKIIAKMTLESDGKKLLQKDVLERAGMSRANFNSRYNHLNDYITGRRDIFALAHAISDGQSTYMEEITAKYKEKCKELNSLYAEFDRKLENQINHHITSLMMNDKVLHDSSDIRKELESQAIQNNSLTEKLKEKELEITKLKVFALKNSKESDSFNHSIQTLEPELNSVFRNALLNNDIDVFEDEKESAIQLMSNKAKRFLNVEDRRVVLFIDRYLCRFERFLSFHFQPSADSLVIRLPLFTRTEISMFVKGLAIANPIDIYVPICESVATTTALRRFYNNHVPPEELNWADKLYIPSFQDGYDSITVFRVGLE